MTREGDKNRHHNGLVAPSMRAALDALWDEVSSRPLWLSYGVIKTLKLRRHTKLELIDSSKLPLMAHRGQVNDCSGCTDICCIGPKSTVMLSLVDIATLVDIGRTDLIELKKPRLSPIARRTSEALERTANSSLWQTLPVLKQNSFSACEALDVEGRCTLYPHWPLSCARFPYTYHMFHEDIYWSRRCQSFWVRDDAQEHQREMAASAAASYNARVKDLVLLAFERERLEKMGFGPFLFSAAKENKIMDT